MNRYNFDHNFENLTIAFDVDSCLITWQDRPNYRVIKLYRAFQKLGCKMVVWSGGGKDYAESWADRLGLAPDISDCKLTTTIKPDIAFDDERIELGKVNVLV